MCGQEMIKKIEAKYPGQGVAKFVYECWAELKLFNASGGTSPVSPNLYESRTSLGREALFGRGHG